MRLKRHQSGGPEDQLLIQSLEIIVSKPQLSPHSLKTVGLVPHLLPRTHIAGGDPAAALQQQLDQGQIAHADTDDCNAFVPDTLHIFRKGQAQHLTHLN